MAPLVDVPPPTERGLQGVAPEEFRRRQLPALNNWILAGARVQPVVLAFEDLHWADPTTIDVLKGVAERGALAPLFVLATTRPEFKPPWGGALASWHDLARAARPASGAAYGRRDRRPTCSAAGPDR